MEKFRGDELSKFGADDDAHCHHCHSISIFSLEAKHPITKGDGDERPPLRLPSFFLYIQVNYSFVDFLLTFYLVTISYTPCLVDLSLP